MFTVRDNFITEAEATYIKDVEVHEYGFRAGTLKRAPKAGFYRNEKVTYSWGQHTSEHEKEEKFPSWMEEIAKRVEEKYGEPVNHAIVIRYSDGYENHAPWHKDKAEEVKSKNNCMKRGTGFYNISVGVPRTFELGRALVEKPSQAREDYEVLLSEKLPHRSLLPVTAEQNAAYHHWVPKEASGGERWSLIFRTIKGKDKKKRARYTDNEVRQRFEPAEKKAKMTQDEYLTAALKVTGEEFLKFFEANHCRVFYNYEGLCLANGNLDEFRANPLVFILANEPMCCTSIAKMFIESVLEDCRARSSQQRQI